MKTTIYLVRHAAYESPDHILPFRLPGFHLSEQGKKKAKELADFFSTKSISAIYSSPIARARETAEIIAGKRKVMIDDRLIEVRSPAQGKPEGFPESMGGWKMYETGWYKKNKGETQEEIYSRMKSFMDEKIEMHRGKEIVVVSHGDPIMFYLRKTAPYIQMGHYLALAF